MGIRITTRPLSSQELRDMNRWLNQHMAGHHRKFRMNITLDLSAYLMEIEFSGRSDLVALFKLAYG